MLCSRRSKAPVPVCLTRFVWISLGWQEGARAAVAQMQRMNPELADKVTFQTFHWGETNEQQLQCPYDVILCSDLIYGDTRTSQLLADTLTTLVHLSPGVRVISCHERRWAGEIGRAHV